jgi:hypothetical protein
VLNQSSRSDEFYRSRQWRQLSAIVLRQHPVCECCGLAPSAIVDHIEPLARAPQLCLARANLWSVCQRCSNRLTTMFDLPASSGVYQPDIGCDEQGNPTDRLHSWNRSSDLPRSKRELVDLLRSLPLLPVTRRPPLLDGDGRRGKRLGRKERLKGWNPVV